MATQVRIGTEFTAPYADSSFIWKVVKRIGGKPLTWLAEIHNDEYEGTQKSFLDSEIKRSIKMSEFWQGKMDERKTWWDNQKVGTVLHYNNGFGDWVRGEVVEKDGEKQLKATALVGNWREGVKPTRQVGGSLTIPYHTRQVLDGASWQPDIGCIWEASENQRKRYDDPTQMEPLDLSIPEKTNDDEKEAELWEKVNEVRDLLRFSNGHINKTLGKSADQLLSEIRGIVGTNGSRTLFDF